VRFIDLSRSSVLKLLADSHRHRGLVLAQKIETVWWVNMEVILGLGRIMDLTSSMCQSHVLACEPGYKKLTLIDLCIAIDILLSLFADDRVSVSELRFW
jgi:hypothetical protein